MRIITMLDNQISMFDEPATINGLNVERIYVSRGKNTVNFNGEICDRCCGLVIGGKIHWIDITFATYTELHYVLRPLNILLTFDGAWGLIKEGQNTRLTNQVTKLKHSETELFGSDSSYMDRSQRLESGSIWWTVEKIKARYFEQDKAEA